MSMTTTTPPSVVLVRREGHSERRIESKQENELAAKKKIRQTGEPLPTMIPSSRVVRALEGTLTEKQFISLYDKASGRKGKDARPLTAAQKTAVKAFMEGKSSRDEAMKKAGIKTPSAFLNLMERYHSQG